MNEPGQIAQGLHARLSRHAPWLLGALVFASRLSYLRPGYGVDPDAYRVIAAARTVRTGVYTASRLPGYPLHELATALFLPGGPRVVNGASALMSALAAVALFALAERVGLSRLRALLVALAFAFTPVVFVNSVTSLDYVWSIALGLCAALAVVRGRPLVAGLLLGAAIGARITAGALLVPLACLQLGFRPKEGALSDLSRLSLAALVSAALWFAPVFQSYGSSFFNYDDAQENAWSVVLARAGSGVWGSLGVYGWLAVAVLALMARRSLVAAFRMSSTRWLLAAIVSALLLFGVAFLMLPHEAAYLIPCLPFALLAVARLLPTLAIFELALMLMLSCFLELDADGLHPPGPLAQQRRIRSEQNAAALRVIRRVARLPGKALILAGARLPLIEAKLGGSEQGAHRYLYLLQSEVELEGYVRSGYQLFYVDGSVVARERERFGIVLEQHGAQRL